MKNVTKRITKIAMLILLVSVFTTGCQEVETEVQKAEVEVKSLVLVSDGVAKATIVIPDNSDSWTQMAAGWVQEYVQKGTGAQLEIVPESKKGQGVLISVGHTQLAQEAGITTDKLKFDGCRMLVKGDTLFLVGRDVDPLSADLHAIPNPEREPWDYIRYIVRGQGPPSRIGAKGTCRAATLFLEDVCGVRWLAPSAKGTYIPSKKTLTVQADLDKTFEPYMAYHSNRLLYGDSRSEPGAYANNYRISIKVFSVGGHTYPRWVPEEKYYEEHPEYFVLQNGKRTGIGNHLCASNQGVRQLILEAMQSLFDNGYDLVQLGQSDGYVACECGPCRKLSNSSGERDKNGELKIENTGEPMHDLARWVAEQCLEKYPGRYIHMLIYGSTSARPDKIKAFPANVMFEFASGASPELIRRFEGLSSSGGTVYTPWHWTDFGIGMGMKMGYTEAADIMKQYKELGITGIHSSGGQCWGLQGPTYYVFGKMMGDPSLDPEPLLREYCHGLYGPAGDEMIAFFKELHKVSDYGTVLHRVTATERYPIHYPPARLKKLNDLLKAAEAAADTQHHKNWVQTTRDEFDFVRYVANSLALFEQYKKTSDPGFIPDLRKSVETFDEYRTRVVNYDGQYVFDYFPGHGILSCVLTQGRGGSKYGADWRDVKKLVDTNNLSGLSIGQSPCCIDKPFTLNFDSEDIEGAFKIVYTKNAPKADGKMDEAQWQNAPPIFMYGAVKTEIRGLYDDENLYIAYLCEELKPDGPNGKNIKRDNPICFMDLVEFYVDPTSSVEATTNYQIIVGATNDAIQDLRQGFDGPGIQDTSWNADGFYYGFDKDLANKNWCVEMVIPLKDLGATAPKDGDVWLGNFSRQGAGLFQWSKGGTPSFCNPKSFNKFRFVKKI